MSRVTATDVDREVERVRVFDAKMRAKGISDHDRAELHRFASMLSERGRSETKAALGPDADTTNVDMRPMELDS